MKIGVAVAPENALPSAFVVWRGIEESIKKAAEYGYDGVELALSKKEDVDPGRIKELCKQYNVEISAISTGQIFAAEGLYLTDPDPVKRKEALAVLRNLVDLAANFGKKVNLGRVRGVIHNDETYDMAAKRLIIAIQELATYAEPYGVEIIVEPVNRYEINFINKLKEGYSIIKKVKNNNVKLMPDVFHMNIEDQSIISELVRYREHISYIHFADSNRLAPGQGHLHFVEIVNTLKALDYNGWVTIEILPEPDPDTAARQAIDYLKQFV